MKKVLYIIFALLALPCVALSQNLRKELKFKHRTIEQGLSQNTVNCIAKDHEGFMWFGTNDGLNKYDGYDFTVYRTPQSLSDNKIYAVFEDSRKLLWVGTRDGLNLYIRERDFFFSFTHSESNPRTISDNFVRTICEDHNGTIWIGTLKGGLNKLDIKNRRFEAFVPHDPAQALSTKQDGQNVSSVINGDNGKLWIGTDSPGIYQFDPETKQFRFFPFAKRPNPGAKTGKKLYCDSEGDIWVCTQGNGLYLFRHQTQTFEHFAFQQGNNSISSNIVKDIFEDENGTFWVATDGEGLNLLDKKTRQVVVYKHHINIPHSLSSNAVYSLYPDNQGIIWIGTFAGGINIFDKNEKQFAHFRPDGISKNSLSHKSVLAFCEDSHGDIWIGTDGGGLNRFEIESENFTHFFHDPEQTNSISSNVVTDIYAGKNGKLWIGTYAGGLNQFDPQTGSFKCFVHSADNPKSISNNNVWDILEDSRGNFWIGTLGGLDLFDRQKQEFTKILPTEGNPQASFEKVTTIFEDSHGELWIGGLGLRKYNYAARKFETQVFGKNNDVSLANYDIRDIHQDKQGNIWIGTEGGGLIFYNPKNHKLKVYNKNDGLPNDAIHAILEDDQNNLWLSTNNGICKFDPQTGNSRNYDMHDGLQSNQFSYSAALKNRDGLMFFGGINGFNMFHPDSIKDNPHLPPVRFTGIEILNKEVSIHDKNSPLEKHITQTDKIELRHDQNVITIKFTALNYTSSQKNQYSYKLQGMDNSWSPPVSRRFVSYTQLPPGEYTLHVKATNNDGMWTKESAALKIIVKPPFWKTKLAYVFYVLIFGLILYSFRRMLLTRFKLRNDLKIKELEKRQAEELSQMKLRFFTNISHEFRTPLTLILGPLQKMIAEGKGDNYVRRQHDLMFRNANRLLQLINQLIDFRKLESGNMKLLTKRSDIVRFIRDIKYAFDDFAQQNRIEYIFQSSLKNFPLWFDHEKLEKIMYNLLSNAFKFTSEGGKITITVEKKQETEGKKHKKTPPMVFVEVKDSGIGISQDRLPKIFDRYYQISNSQPLKQTLEQTGSGIGLALTKQLVELHKGRIEVESQQGKGTAFRLFLPIGSQHLAPEQKMQTQIQPDSQHDEFNALANLQSVGAQTQPGEQKPETNQKTKKKNKRAGKNVPLVLIVEDNADVRNYIKDNLQGEYKIIEAENGKVGLEKAEQHNPDLIITDVMMPEMDGMEMCRQIKENIAISHIPVLMLTARSTEDQRMEGYQTGADGYLIKPFETRMLQLRVKNLIESRQKMREQFRRDFILQPKEVKVASADERFLKKAVSIVEHHIGDSNFDVKSFVEEMGMSRSVLYRKLRAVTDQSANEFIRIIRLKRAAQLLAKNEFTVAEITYDVGFNDPQYFSKCFRKQYGMTPTEYASNRSPKK